MTSYIRARQFETETGRLRTEALENGEKIAVPVYDLLRPRSRQLAPARFRPRIGALTRRDYRRRYSNLTLRRYQPNTGYPAGLENIGVQGKTMSGAFKTQHIIIADPVSHTRNLVADVLRSLGHYSIFQARDGKELLELTIEYEPRIVITTSRLPELSGLEFTRLVRAGHKNVSRLLSIIVMTDT
ncbi:MAG: response regulator, partial [Burkholderiales bacterium]